MKLKTENAKLVVEHKTVSNQLQRKLDIIANKSSHLDQRIATLKISLDKYNTMLTNVTKMTGLQGNTLLTFLFDMKKFGQKRLVENFSPLTELLQGNSQIIPFVF